jgi:hypothetical protein
MSNVKSILDKRIENKLKEIELPDFDINVTEEDTWFTEALKQIEDMLEDRVH